MSCTACSRVVFACSDDLAPTELKNYRQLVDLMYFAAIVSEGIGNDASIYLLSGFHLNGNRV